MLAGTSWPKVRGARKRERVELLGLMRTTVWLVVHLIAGILVGR